MNRDRNWWSTRWLLLPSDLPSSPPGITFLPPWSACIRASRRAWPALAPAVSKASPPFAMPDMATLMAALTLVFSLFVFQGGRKLFRDADAGWHIRTGEWILETRALPRTDPY